MKVSFISTSRLTEGHPSSFVHGFIHNGLFEGKVRFSDKLEDEYHIEPSLDHFQDKKNFHSVIYKASDLNYPYAYGSNVDLSDKTRNWMEKAREVPQGVYQEDVEKVHHRYKTTTNNKLICQLHLRADHLFTKNRARGEKERALLLMAKHVQAAHKIYKETEFVVNGKSTAGYGFAIKKMRANNTEDETKPGNPYAQEFIGVEKFLDIISLEPTSSKDGNRFCLSHVFTYRDFEDGVLGLAWVAEPKGVAGGICETSKLFQDGRKKTLNTGLVTFINYNKQVPSRVSEITFAHELGHNFGAQHDSSECSSQVGGNYIMFPKATSGTDPNNRKFSKCSIDYISPVLAAKADCFKQTGEAICGNNLVEDGEECDCGFFDDCNDNCCNHANGTVHSCKLKGDAKCSPSQGLCCNDSCQFKNNDTVCETGDCIEDTRCNSMNATCPQPVTKMDNVTDCNGDRGVCLKGECTGSRCLKFNMSECQCTEKENQCMLCCMSNGVCSPLEETGKEKMHLLPGAPCNNFLGYCDILRKCRAVDSEGPLERIKNLIFGGDAIGNLVDWVKDYWWATILIGLGLIILMAGFIKVCSVATPSSNPNKPKARTMSLRRNPRSNPGFVNNEPPPPYDIEMGDRNNPHGRQNGRRAR
ncbi:disintegrin and metalloproteinase domain-containing protein 10-like isoform X2 [Xenia sp. Carnegie-2017]|uniref:disintegrin and metalloproteinase domain-containing protein 10-like isoform X2 n=1 Tax=Xenia sp. Carnegie-2017 TaxID=2897299 RepID=UPI001F03B377|nr:disintegrin and metalloproteinase domain-containing protein 10-like isoform X2 [Xenia sp. Carnegie-2017]